MKFWESVIYLSVPQEMAYSKTYIDIQMWGAVNFLNFWLLLQASW